MSTLFISYIKLFLRKLPKCGSICIFSVCFFYLAAGVNQKNIKLLNERDICDLFSKDIGQRSEFRNNLKEWIRSKVIVQH